MGRMLYRSLVLIVVGGLCFGAAYSVAAPQSDPLPKTLTTSPVALPSLPALTHNDRILVVAPHPDDETIGAGGFLEEAVRAGAAIEVVVATDGSKRGRKEVRYREILSALGKLGVPSTDVDFLNYRDGTLSQQASFLARLEQICNAFHPNIVVGTHPKDYHPDHAAVGRAIDWIGQRANHSITAYLFVVHYHRYPLPDAFRPDLPEVPAPHIADKVSTWESLPLDEQAEQAKCAAVLEYHSQIGKKDPLRRGLLISFVRKNEVFAVRTY